jgi:hypothetical protein
MGHECGKLFAASGYPSALCSLTMAHRVGGWGRILFSKATLVLPFHYIRDLLQLRRLSARRKKVSTVSEVMSAARDARRASCLKSPFRWGNVFPTTGSRRCCRCPHHSWKSTMSRARLMPMMPMVPTMMVTGAIIVGGVHCLQFFWLMHDVVIWDVVGSVTRPRRNKSPWGQLGELPALMAWFL